MVHSSISKFLFLFGSVCVCVCSYLAKYRCRSREDPGRYTIERSVCRVSKIFTKNDLPGSCVLDSDDSAQ